MGQGRAPGRATGGWSPGSRTGLGQTSGCPCPTRWGAVPRAGPRQAGPHHGRVAPRGQRAHPSNRLGDPLRCGEVGGGQHREPPTRAQRTPFFLGPTTSRQDEQPRPAGVGSAGESGEQSGGPRAEGGQAEPRALATAADRGARGTAALHPLSRQGPPGTPSGGARRREPWSHAGQAGTSLPGDIC